jgi:hypothetical protein
MEGLGPAFREWVSSRSTIAAIVLVVAGLLFVGLEVQSPNRVYFTGERVTGTIEGGIVYYQVNDAQYTQDYPEVLTPPDGTRVSVFFEHDNPSTGLVDRPTRWIEAIAILVWFVAAATLLVVSALRRRARRRRLAAG